MIALLARFPYDSLVSNMKNELDAYSQAVLMGDEEKIEDCKGRITISALIISFKGTGKDPMELLKDLNQTKKEAELGKKILNPDSN